MARMGSFAQANKALFRQRSDHENSNDWATTYLDEAVKRSPERTRHLYLVQRAKLHQAKGGADAAIADLEAAVKLQPEWTEALEQLAKAYEKKQSAT